MYDPDQIIEHTVDGITLRGPRSALDQVRSLRLEAVPLAGSGTLQIPIDLALEAAARHPEDHSGVELAERMLADTADCPPPVIEYFLPGTWADNDETG